MLAEISVINFDRGEGNMRKTKAYEQPTCGDLVFDCEMPPPKPSTQRNLRLPSGIELRWDGLFARTDDENEFRLIGQVGLHVRTSRYCTMKKQIRVTHIDPSGIEQSIDFNYSKLKRTPKGCAKKLRKHGIHIHDDVNGEALAIFVLQQTLENNEPCPPTARGRKDR